MTPTPMPLQTLDCEAGVGGAHLSKRCGTNLVAPQTFELIYVHLAIWKDQWLILDLGVALRLRRFFLPLWGTAENPQEASFLSA